MQLIIVLLVVISLLFPSSAHAQSVGAMEYNSATGRFRVYDGSSWTNMGSALYLPLGACSPNGKIDFDGLIPALKYCGNGQWRSFAYALTLYLCNTPGRWGRDPVSGGYAYCNGLVWVAMNATGIPIAGL